MRLAILMTFIGSTLGTLLVQRIDAGVLEQAIPFLLIGIVLLIKTAINAAFIVMIKAQAALLNF